MNLCSSIAFKTIFLSLSSSAENIKAWFNLCDILDFYSSDFSTTLGTYSFFLLNSPYTSAETDYLAPDAFYFFYIVAYNSSSLKSSSSSSWSESFYAFTDGSECNFYVSATGASPSSCWRGGLKS